MKGIDISMHNRSINFNSVKNNGIEAIIIKATEGVDYIDPNFETYYSQSRNMGFHIGFYHFMSEKTNPTKQAEGFYNAINGKEYNIIPVLDIEINKYNRSRKEISDRCIEFLTRFKELSGIDCVIYTGGFFGRDLLDDRVKQYKGWIAHYGVSSPMNTGFQVVGHQYTETGKVSGISGDCDMNNFNEGILLRSEGISEPKSETYEFFSNKTRYLQSILGILSDNIWGPITDEAARNVIAGIPYVTPELTRWIQRVLGINIDGVFYTETEAAVKQYQRNHGLVVDGLVGYNTLKSMALS